jgi:hypothetical protein
MGADDPAATCHDCFNYNSVWSETGKGNLQEKCDKEGEAGVPAVNTVTKKSDCAEFGAIHIALQDDAHPKRLIKDDPDQVARLSTEGLSTSVDPYVDFPKQKKRRRDNY